MIAVVGECMPAASSADEEGPDRLITQSVADAVGHIAAAWERVE
ncbi:hypothetical protein [Roseovarius dicentrarchi]|nr:hypothetical protein [Roseovarius dicentrarchi]